MPGRAPLILASASPRRLDLLAQIGIWPDRVAPTDIDETRRRDESPRELAERFDRSGPGQSEVLPNERSRSVAHDEGALGGIHRLAKEPLDAGTEPGFRPLRPETDRPGQRPVTPDREKPPGSFGSFLRPEGVQGPLHERLVSGDRAS